MKHGGLPGTGVRPTRRCLADDLDLPLPDIGTALEDVEHELVHRAQDTPARVAAGGGKRVAAIDDRVLWKVKTESWRGVAAEVLGLLNQPEHDHGPLGTWWLCAAGHRQSDSAQRDFYSRLEDDCARAKHQRNKAGEHVGTHTSSAHLMPVEWDVKRLQAELGFRATQAVMTTVRRAACEAAATGATVAWEVNGHSFRFFVEDDDEMYLVVSARSLADQNLFALVLSSIPGIHRDDWMPEPPGLARVSVEEGEVLWAAIITGETRAALSNEFATDC